MHPRITVHESLLGRGLELSELLESFERAGAVRVGISVRHALDPGGVELIRASSVEVTHLVHPPLFALQEPATWPDAQATAIAALDAARATGARCVYATTGPAPAMTWEEAAIAFVSAAQPVAAHAQSHGPPLLIEPTNALFAMFGFVHTLRDTVDVASAAGLGVCLDVQHCWTERGLRDTITAASGAIGLVQISDQLASKLVPFRAVPGDGIIPLERIVHDILATGYEGLFDLELYAEPDVDPAETIARAAERLGQLLDRVSGG